jgi:hypothetical protein
MRKSVKDNLKGLTIVAPVIAAGAATAYFGDDFAQKLQAYEYARTELVNQYFGNFMASVQQGWAYCSRVAFDILSGLGGLIVGGQIMGRVEDALPNRAFKKAEVKRREIQEAQRSDHA